MLPKNITYNVYVIPFESDDKIPAKIVQNRNKFNLTIKFDNIEKSSDPENNWFRQVRQLDRLLNEIGYRLLCNGTSIGVNCYGFCSTMGGGSKAYRYDGHTVLVFEYSPWNKYASEEEQNEFLKFISEKTSEVKNKMRKVSNDTEEGIIKRRQIYQNWLDKKEITLKNFWKRELWN